MARFDLFRHILKNKPPQRAAVDGAEIRPIQPALRPVRGR
jgi:hypothetical protein